jgi:hypothetical protein
VELLIEVFEKNAAIILLKLTNLIKPHNEDNYLKNFIEAIIMKGLKAKNCMPYFSVLVSLKNTLANEQFTKLLEDTLFELFQSAEEF